MLTKNTYITSVIFDKNGDLPHRNEYRSYSLSNLMVILPFLAVFTTLRALFITPIPNLDSSAEEIVNSLGFEVFVFII